MKILLAVQGNPAHTPGGIETYVRCIGPAMAERGHEIHVLWTGFRLTSHDVLERGVHIHYRPWLGPRLIGRALGLPLTGLRARVALGTWRGASELGKDFDVVEAQEWTSPALLLRETPLLLHLHTPLRVQAPIAGVRAGLDVRFADAMESAVARRAVVQTSPSLLLKNCLERSGWPGAGAIRVVRLPVDLARWRRVAPVDSTERVVLVVGRLERRKAPELVVEAAAHLAGSFPDLKVVFVGSSNGQRDRLDYGRWLEQRASRLGVDCAFAGTQRGKELERWMAKARVLVVPSAFDNLPVAALEGMAAARPVVCSDRTGCTEILPTPHQLVFRSGSSVELADRLAPLIEDSAFAGQLGRACLRVAEKELDPKVIAAERERCMIEASR